MTQVIRRAVIADLDALARLRIDFLQDAHGDAPLPIEFTETTRRFLADRLAESGSLVFWVAERDGQIVAQAMISLFQRLPNLSNPNGLEAYVSNFYIDATYRRQGAAPLCCRRWSRTRGIGVSVGCGSTHRKPLRGSMPAPVLSTSSAPCPRWNTGGHMFMSLGTAAKRSSG